MSVITIRKGHNLRIGGEPGSAIVSLRPAGKVAVYPSDFYGMKPRILVKIGEEVKKGTPLFADKRFRDVVVTSPAGGRVSEVILGDRRRLEKIVIAIADSEEAERFTSCSLEECRVLEPDDIRTTLLRSGLWPVLRQRPFSIIADPEASPKAVFVSAMPTAPFVPSTSMVLEGREHFFQAGLLLLRRLTGASVHLTVSADEKARVLVEAEGVELHRFRGPHPAGNVGIQIHHIAPIRHRDDVVWYLLPRDVARIGELFLTGELPTDILVALGGEALSNRCHVRTRQGVLLEDLLKNNDVEEPARLISGDVLTGIARRRTDALGFYDEVVSVIPESGTREFLGWLLPGRNRYSASNLFLSSLAGNKGTRLDTALNGSRRVIIPFGNIESVLPMDILPTWLLKMILARDIDEMERLGIYECDPEDFALCSFVDASKMEISAIIREGLDYMQQNG